MQYLIRLIKRTYQMALPHERQVVMSNVASLSVLQAITYVLPIVIIPYLFRTIGAGKFGLIAFAQAFIQYFMLLTDYGFNIAATKEISLYHDNDEKVHKIFSSVMTVKLLLVLVSLCVLSVVVYFVPKFRNDWPVYVLSFGAVFGHALFPVWYFQGTEKMRYITSLSVIGGIVFAFFIFFFVRQPQDYLMVPLTNSSVFLLTGILGQYIVLRRFRVKFTLPGARDILQQLKSGWDVFISIAAINAYTATRIFAVGLLTNNNITGFYSMAERIANVCQTFPLNSFSQAIFPRLSKIYHKNQPKALHIMQHIQQITMVISLICLPVIFIFAGRIVALACGNEYPAAVLSLRFLLISVFFVHANAFRVQFLLVCGKTNTYSRIHVITAIAGLPLIILFIKAFSYAGAALATVIIEVVIFAITYVTVKKLKFEEPAHSP